MSTLLTLPQSYFERSSEMLDAAWSANTAVIEELAPVIGKSVAGGAVIHTFGSGHSELISREIIGRAGGLACVTGVVDPTEGFVENVSGYGAKLIERYDRQYRLIADEVMIVVSNSGKNVSPIDVALYAKRKGLRVVALTSLAMSRDIVSQHPSGRRLFEIADFVLDSGGVLGDALLELPTNGRDNGAGCNLKAGPTSTLIACSLLNWLILAVIEWLGGKGHAVPVLKSQNLPGGLEHNRKLADRYQGRLSRPLA